MLVLYFHRFVALVRYRQITLMLILDSFNGYKGGTFSGHQAKGGISSVHQASIILHILWTWLVQKSTSVCFPESSDSHDLFIGGLKVVFINGGVDVAFRGEVVQRRVHLLLWHLRPHLQNNSSEFVRISDGIHTGKLSEHTMDSEFISTNNLENTSLNLICCCQLVSH